MKAFRVVETVIDEENKTLDTEEKLPTKANLK